MSFSNLFVTLLSDVEFLAWLQKILLTIVYTIDSVIYQMIVTVYNLFEEIASTTLFSEDIIQEFGERVYTLLGIFMLFKVSFSFINYIINPDSFLDKEKGVGKVIMNVVLVLALLVLTPTLFHEAMDIQKIILKDNSIGSLILGINGDSTSVFKKNAGETMAYTTFSAFYHINTDVFPDCHTLMTSDSDTSACKSALSAANVPDIYYTTFDRARTGPAISMLFRDVSLLWNTVEVSDNRYTVISYAFLISTLVGGAMALILATFCFDVAVRSIKLGFLQLIAPIPIISRIDPKSSKDGLFSKWFKVCVKTYLDIFIRLVAIYFAVFVISIVVQAGFANGASIYAKVFIIFGALLFAKQLPQFINDLGFKLDTKDFTVNPFKKLAAIPVAGAAAATLYGGVDSLVRGNGFMHGIKTNFREADWKGDKKKNYMFDTYDRRIKREVNQKADPTKGIYEARRQSKEREEQIKKGNDLKTKHDSVINSSKDAEARKHINPVTGAAFADYKEWKKYDDTNNKTDAVQFDATTTANALFKNQEFKNSYINLAVKKQEMYNAKNIASQVQNEHSAATSQYNQLKSQYDQFNTMYGAADSRTKDALVAANNAKATVDKAYEALVDANAKVGKTTSIFNMTEAKHKDMQKIHVKDAEAEAQWDVASKLK